MTPQQALEQYFGYHSFRGSQLSAIEHVLAKRHTLVIMPTGMGKSLCYQLPAILCSATKSSSHPCPSITLVISPLIALMKDQVDALLTRGISATFINSSLRKQEREERYASVAAGDFDLLYVTPERFRKPEFVEVMAQRSVSLLAVDEAHCISEWGHDFRPDYTRLEEFRRLLGNPTTIALTATATPEVQQDIVRQLGLEANEMQLIHEGIDRPNLELQVKHVWDDEDKLDHIIDTVRDSHHQQGSGIVYFTLIKTLERFSSRLLEEGIVHVCYHGDLERTRRRNIQNAFMEGEQSLVLATNAFGMGIDKEDIRFVLHAEVPGSMEAYYQEIGRAGRDGLASLCLLLYDQRDLATQMEFIRWSNPNSEYFQQVYLYLTERKEQVQAFGMEWLNKQLHSRGKADHRLATTFALLDRYNVVQDSHPPGCFNVVADLPDRMLDDSRLATKLERDQRKLYALVEYANYPENRKRFIHNYFGLPYDS
ncbi:MAG: ATP-dependent DNA helicase [Planctomycetaceae bacterium]|nr:ATP-dependent DNA helicase [Planctomycetaceae bacterium]MBP61359.1 ATP-dependent DNA helicase [Planctomycetaceae bacterium]